LYQKKIIRLWWGQTSISTVLTAYCAETWGRGPPSLGAEILSTSSFFYIFFSNICHRRKNNNNPQNRATILPLQHLEAVYTFQPLLAADIIINSAFIQPTG
jgi:hypothetical protein